MICQDFVSANHDVVIETKGVQERIYNYFSGNDPAKWQTKVRAYSEIVYHDIWKGVDLRLYGNGSDLEQEFIVKPRADISQVRMAYRGIDGLEVAKDGSLVINTAAGAMHESVPRIYQEKDGQHSAVQGQFELLSESSYTFSVSDHDPQYALIIDPTLLYSTFLGGGAGVGCCYGVAEYATGIAVDASGSAYVAGITGSDDFPITPGSYQSTYASGFVTKLSPLGDRLAYSTYFGGQLQGNIAGGNPIAVNSAGQAYLTGIASAGFPTTSNAFQKNVNGAFVTVLSAQGDALVYSSGFGDVDWGNSIAIDSSGRAYFTGSVAAGGSIPVTSNAFQSSHPSAFNRSAFLGVLDPTQSGTASLVYGSYLGGSGGDAGFGIAVDSYGMAYIGGYANSQDFPVTPGAFQVTYGGGSSDGFITKFNPNASTASASVLYSTYLGGGGPNGAEYLFGISVDSLGNASVGGQTGSADFPITPGEDRLPEDFRGL